MKKKPAASDKPAARSAAKRAPLRITRVYTRIGDGGRTQLASGRAIAKSHPRLDAYGTIDELQTALGAARDAFAPLARKRIRGLRRIADHLLYLQNLLFTLGGDLSTPLADRWPAMPLVAAADTAYLEKLIDALNAGLPPLADFVLPGGHAAVTALHGCRVICRRAERAIERLAEIEPIGEAVRPFVNRLSDAFFVLARATDARLRAAGLAPAETIWRRDLEPPPMP
jgi:cob(I)alamin adenosyltransferase